MKKFTLFAIVSLFVFCNARGQIITTVAGDSTESFGGDNGLAIDAELDGPYSVALDGLGNYYITDGYNNRIRKVNTAGIITTIAGNDTVGYNGDSIPATAAQLSHPVGIVCDASGNIFFCDAYNNRVRKINSSGIITTVAGTGLPGYNGDNIAADTAVLWVPWCLAIDHSGNLYITEWGSHRVRKVDVSGIITTVAGTGILGNSGDNGPATAAEINEPYGIAIDSAGNIYFADSYSLLIRKIDAAGIITTFAGGGIAMGDNGPADSARLEGPGGVALDDKGNVYIGDLENNRIRKVNTTTNIITTIAGDGIAGFSGDNGLAVNAELKGPDGLAIDAAGNIYFADFYNNRIRYIKSTTAVNELNERVGILLSPNPTAGEFRLNITTENTEQFHIAIYNSIGERVKELSSDTNSPVTIHLDQPAGIYYLSATGNNFILNRIITLIK